MSGSIFLGSTSYSVNEQDGTVTFSIERTGDLTAPVSVQYATNANTAEQGFDFTDTDGSVTLAAGEANVQITIPILNDTLSEPTEIFNISLISVSSGSLLFPRTALVSILDDENPVIEPPNPPFTSDFTVSLDTVSTDLSRPVNMEWVPGSTEQAFVIELGGVIKVINTTTGQTLSTALDISSKVNSNRDGGLLDIALHPDFENNPYLYAFYVVDPADTAGNTGNAGADGVGNRFAYVVRFDVDTSGTIPVIDASSETILVGGAGQSLNDISGNGALNYSDVNYQNASTYVASDVDPITGEYKQDYIKMDSTSHIGGALAFGPDGNLYISIGDGVAFNYADTRGQSVQSVDALAGKILRVDPITGNGLADNPFVEAGSDFTDNSSKVWQTGLRNPYAMAFSDDGELYISETGWTSWEEVNMGGAGANFGWPWYEGGDNGILEQTPTYRDFPEAQAFYAAVANGDIVVTSAYRGFSHDVNDPGYNLQAIVGGSSVYTGDQYPDIFKDDYFFFDIVNSRLFSVDTNDRTQLEYVGNVGEDNPIVNLVQGPDGYLYAMMFNGSVKRLNITENTPSINEAPFVTSAIDQQDATTDEAFDFVIPNGTFNDPNNDPLTLTATLSNGDALPNWLTFNPVTGTFSGTPDQNSVGQLSIQVVAADTGNLNTSEVFNLVVAQPNDAPTLTAPALNQSTEANTAFTYTIPTNMFVDDGSFVLSAEMLDGSALPTWLSFDAATGTFSGTSSTNDAGNLVIKITATDAFGKSGIDYFMINVEATENTAPIVATPITDQTVDEDSAFNFVFDSNAFTDPEGATLTYTATLGDGSALPNWLNFDANTRTFSGTPNDVDIADLNIRVTASDPAGLSISDEFTIVVNSINDAPVLVTELVDQTAQAGDVFNFVVPSVTFADADDTVLTLSATLADGSPLPTWLTFDAQTGTVSGTPAIADVGDLNLTITATDAAGLSVSDEFVIAVNAVNTAPIVATPITDQTVDEDSAFNFVFDSNAFTDPEGATLTYTATLGDGSALPNWLNFDANTRTFSGTPNDVDIADLNIRVTASDPAGLSISDEFTIAVNPINDAPVLVTELVDQTAQAGDAFTFVIPTQTFDDVDDTVLTLSATLADGSPLPTWLTFDAQTGTVSGTPAIANVGDLNLTITATDAAGLSVSDEFKVTIAPEQSSETLHNDIANTVQFLNGTAAEKDVFVINGNSADYGWGPTEDGLGLVVWGPTGNDLLFDFDEIRFNDLSVSLVQIGNEYVDVPNSTQFLTGESNNDTFIIDGNSTDYNWGLTEDNDGVVVWGATGHDLLFEFENIEFNDQTIPIDDIM